MKNLFLLFIDLIVILLGTALALILRENFELNYARLTEVLPYFLATTVVSATVIILFGVNRVIWRFSALPDYLRITLAMAAITISSVTIIFVFNRLEGVPRSLPFLQFNICISLLIGLRVFYRLHHLARRSHKEKMAPLRVVEQSTTETVLLVGLSRLTETYLQSISELAQGRVKVAGVLGHRSHHVGRLVATHKILGTPENIDRILSDLDVCGIAVDKIVVTAPSFSFSDSAREAISVLKLSKSLEVVHLSEKLGFEAVAEPPTSSIPVCVDSALAINPMTFEIGLDELRTMQRRPYWMIKRALDVIAAFLLLIVMCPIMIIVAASLLFSIGNPIIFWQQRPGLGGRPFRLYKFRSMGAAYAADGRRLSDEKRISRVGSFLRRTRLDELPQLFNVLRGDMSFIGPRPLLPRDQDDAFRARLLLRPGLTGWAQVVGGRAISAEDKAALDVWYVKNAGLYLDFKVVLKTIPIVIFGETISRNLIERAWRDLQDAGILRSRFSGAHQPVRRAAA